MPPRLSSTFPSEKSAFCQRDFSLYPGSDGEDLMGSKQAEGGRPVPTKEVGWKSSSVKLPQPQRRVQEIKMLDLQSKSAQMHFLLIVFLMMNSINILFFLSVLRRLPHFYESQLKQASESNPGERLTLTINQCHPSHLSWQVNISSSYCNTNVQLDKMKKWCQQPNRAVI